MKLFFRILFGSFHLWMGMCLLITTVYLFDASNLWFVYGPFSLLLPLITVTPIVLMVRASYKQWLKFKDKPTTEQE